MPGTLVVLLICKKWEKGKTSRREEEKTKQVYR